MPRADSKPGPAPSSCLACRRRRKKCDLSRAICGRCLNGGSECLWSGGNEPRARVREEDSFASTSRLQPTSPTPRVVKAEAPDPVVTGFKDWQVHSDADVGREPRASVLGTAVLYRMIRPTSWSGNNSTLDSPENFDQSWPDEHRQLVSYSRSQKRQSSQTKRDFGTDSRAGFIDDLNRNILSLYWSVPPSVDATQMMREDYFVQIIREYHSQRASYWFMIPSPATRNSLVVQLKGSKRVKWIVYLAAKIFQAIGQITHDNDPTVQRYIGWIDKLDRKFTIDPHSNPSVSDIAECLRVQLELAFLKFTVVNALSGYSLLQKAVARFIQLVAADTNLYMEVPNGNLVVSFPRTLCAPRYELRRFVMYDMMASFLLGVPPLVEYGYGVEYASPSYGFEWVHGIPSALVETISRINSWRARSSIPPINWQVLERHVLAWRPQLVKSGGEDSSGSKVRFAVQESWAHVVLVYIYMGICAVSSHDSRVQASVHRIIELGETTVNLPISVHMLSHCVVAGLAARLEKHRLLVYDMLNSFKNTRVWLFRGPEFSQVLYNLWHGIGRGGAPVTWDDYVQSRCAVMPI